MKAKPHGNFSNLFSLIRVSRDAYAKPKKEDNKIGTYLEVVNHFSKSYATNANMSMATSKIDHLVKVANESAVLFIHAIHLKAVKCGNAYFDERTRKVFINGLLLIVRTGAGLFWGYELEAHPKMLAQYVDTSLDRQHEPVEELKIS